MLVLHLFVSYANVNLCHCFSSSWYQGLAATSACGSSWTFLFSFLARLYEVQGELVQSPWSSTSASVSASAFPSHCDKVLYASFSKVHISTATHQMSSYLEHKYPGGPVFIP